MSEASRDPFYIVKDEVNETLNSLQDKFRRWQGMAVGSAQRNAGEQELHDEIQSLQYMVAEIEKSVDAAEANPARFRLSQAEVSSRRKWALTTQRQAERVSEGVADARSAAAAAGPSSAAGKLAAAARQDNDAFISSEGQRQQLLVARQDQELDALSHHVVRIGELGRDMGTELGLQGRMLEELGEEMDGTQTRLAAAQKKVQHVLDRAGSRGQLMIIAALVVALVVLIFLVIA